MNESENKNKNKNETDEEEGDGVVAEISESDQGESLRDSEDRYLEVLSPPSETPEEMMDIGLNRENNDTNDNNKIFCTYHGSAKGCLKGLNCSFSHENPNRVMHCRWLNSKWGCKNGMQCRYRHQHFPVYRPQGNNIISREFPANFNKMPMPIDPPTHIPFTFEVATFNKPSKTKEKMNLSHNEEDTKFNRDIVDNNSSVLAQKTTLSNCAITSNDEVVENGLSNDENINEFRASSRQEKEEKVKKLKIQLDKANGKLAQIRIWELRQLMHDNKELNDDQKRKIKRKPALIKIIKHFQDQLDKLGEEEEDTKEDDYQYSSDLAQIASKINRKPDLSRKLKHVQEELDKLEEEKEEDTNVGNVIFNPKMHNPENETKVVPSHDPNLEAWDSISYKTPPLSDGPILG